jgi:hypothetical protein
MLLFHFIFIGSISAGDQCVKINIGFCSNLGYNETFLSIGQTQSQIENKLNQFKTLNSVNCHAETKRFLCLFYMPFCSDQGGFNF